MEQIGTDRELLTRQAAARRAGVGVRQIRRAVDGGQIPAYQIGAWIRVRWADVREWIERQRLGPPEARP